MKSIYRTIWVTLAVTGLLSAPAVATSHEEASPSTYAYGIYYECDTSTQDQADTIIEKVFKPIYDQGVEDGDITGWGWMAHAVGGKWRRVVYVLGPSVEAVLEATTKLNSAAGQKDSLAVNRLQQICPSHDDYIWKWVAGSSGDAASMTEDRGKVSMSTYWVCNMAKERDLDEMVKETLAPLWNAQVEAGTIASWSWFEHVIGGEYRRLATQTAKDIASILKARAAVIEQLATKHPEAMAQVGESCQSHQDYLWDIQVESP